MIKYSEETDKLVCSFSERLDTDACVQFEKELYKKIEDAKGKSVVFDLKTVDYISSVFLGICMHILKKLGSERLSIVNVQPNVKRVFKISGLDGQIALN
ncbi:MAG: STAS domain-containing protein [Candidatus Omnitrophica bacterium]|nr:STAS domain-containing protein [Candidatus Omnitrophota bacterium]